MTDYEITIGSPWTAVALLPLLPLFWVLSVRSLALMGRVRWLVVNVLRSIVLLLLILALADVRVTRTNDRLTVIYLLDQSLSIPVEHRRAIVDYVNTAIEEQRPVADRVGVIVFGREAAIEIPPIDDAVMMADEPESPLDPEHTNLAAAMKLAQASFPEDAAKRIVVVSDGNENLGDVAEQARGLAAAGIGIDVVPIRYQTRSEVIVERLAIPGDIRREQPFDLKVVVSNTSEARADDSGEISGRLVLSQLVGGESKVLKEKQITLPPGKKVFTLDQRIDAPNFYAYEARFVPDRPEDDAMPQNNRATAFTHVRGKGQVLLIEDYENPGAFDFLAERLGRQGLEVPSPRPSNQLFTTPADLMPYDTVVLANVPREHFTDDQISMLVRNTEQMGAGLVMLGGDNSFGAGGWIGTELEKAMPVDFQIRNAKVVPRGALVMVMHACEIPKGNHWQKVIAHEAIRVLGAQDYCGLIYWGNRGTQWMWGGEKGLVPVSGNRNRMMARVDRMVPGDMPEFDPALKMALAGFRKVPGAAVKHMIVISDGDPSPPDPGVIRALKDIKVTISTVAVGAHGPAGSNLLNDIATATGGKYYAVRNAKALPRIFQREARKVARPLRYENENGFRPYVNYPHEMIKGLEDPLPPLTGYVLTSKKDNPLVEVSLLAPEPRGRATDRNRTILASWTYGLGKAVALTSDAGARWAKDWTEAANLASYDRLFAQMVNWSMRPAGGSAKFTVSSEIEDEQVRVAVTALDENDDFLNFLNMNGHVVGPDLKPIPFKLQQTAPGRYQGTFPTREAGSYFIVVDPGAKEVVEDPQTKKTILRRMPPILTGVNLPYSEEFRNRETNEELLRELTRLLPEGGKRGVLIEPEEKDSKRAHPWLSEDEEEKAFRHKGLAKATSSQDVWYYLVLVGSCLFFFDVFFRRVQVSLMWVPPMVGRTRDWILRREPPPPPDKTIERLRSRKAEVTDRIEQLRAEARFEPPPATTVDLDALEEAGPSITPAGPTTPAAPSLTGEEPPEEESYTERLLRAKKKVWDRRDKQ